MNQILESISNIGIRDVIDMAIIAYVFYKILMLIRETRAEQLLKGIAFLLIATKLSEWSGLYVTTYLLKNTVTLGLIALLIVFQPELRRALEYLGRSKLVAKSIVEIKDEEVKDRIDEIVSAAASLSRQKIGALIILERETGINDVIETGTKIEARISSSLLINIFFPNSPLHDGAVIIRDDRIMAAGCFLPLSENSSLSKELGTRHRAGLGITETTDAVVIIVSEETGAISVAREGKLSRFLDTDTLSGLLQELYKTDDNLSLIKLKWRTKDE
ncbi:MAG TPA: diadenylate cyclase CdaA [Clostridia bacterium]|nr:diadenylate cyclase CdaA [Clostridia bacterium]